MRVQITHLLQHIPAYLPKIGLVASACIGLLTGSPGLVPESGSPLPAVILSGPMLRLTQTKPIPPRIVVHVPVHLPPNAPLLSGKQIHVLKMATHIGQKLGMGTKLAAVAFQESGLGVDPVSPAHYGAGSVGYLALQVVLREHPWLRPYFQGQNWSETLINSPRLSLWVAGYYLLHCYQKAGEDWQQALDLYRYGYGTPGPYVSRIQHRETQLQPYLEQL